VSIQQYLPEAAAAFAAAVLAPGVVRVLDVGGWARRLALPGGVLAAASFLAPAGWAALLCAPYLVACALVALHGLRRLLVHRLSPASELGLTAAMLYLPAAATWLIAHRAGIALLDYPPYWVALTATHFHLAGVVLPVVAAMHTRRRGHGWIVWLVVLGVPLTAIGIGFVRAFETPASIVTAAGGLLVGVQCLRARTPLWVLAGLALFGSMPLAAAYALRWDVRIGEWDALTSMVISHGALNLVFATASLGALLRDQRRLRRAA
jgi:hypothetical protein